MGETTVPCGNGEGQSGAEGGTGSDDRRPATRRLAGQEHRHGTSAEPIDEEPARAIGAGAEESIGAPIVGLVQGQPLAALGQSSPDSGASGRGDAAMGARRSTGTHATLLGWRRPCIGLSGWGEAGPPPEWEARAVRDGRRDDATRGGRAHHEYFTQTAHFPFVYGSETVPDLADDSQFGHLDVGPPGPPVIVVEDGHVVGAEQPHGSFSGDQEAAWAARIASPAHESTASGSASTSGGTS